MTSPPQSSSPDLTQSEFDITRRGYDRQQVDDRLKLLAAKLAEIEKAHQQENKRASYAEEELRSALTKLKNLQRRETEGQNTQTQEGFGYRVEKVLRMAEHEAAEVRSKAAREASALLERARADAEAHRHDVEQSLIARAAKLDEDSTQRQVELDERERQIQGQLTDARQEADHLRSSAQQEAEQLQQAALVEVEKLRARAEQIVRQQHEAADQELRRLRTLQDDVRHELTRMHELLAAEINRQPGAPRHASHSASTGVGNGKSTSEDKREPELVTAKH